MEFHDKLFKWWEANKRELPWRNTRNPYKIMISEFMLQQTQVSRVIPKYNAWIENFPNYDSVADTSNRVILEFWSGLGYNRRALWLKKACAELHKNFSWTPSNLIKLNGIGRYTAHAIPIFAFNFDIATVDINIRKVLAYEKIVPDDISETELWKKALAIVPKGNSRNYHNALMDYGAVKLKKIKGVKIPKQEKFQNSSRMYRGKIIQCLIKNKEADIEKLSKYCNVSLQTIEPILKQLIKEGMVKSHQNKYRL